MKSRFLHQVINSLMIVLTLVWPIVQPLQLKAADFYWDADGSNVGNLADGTNLGGNGTWDTVSGNWSSPLPTSAITTWGNTAADRAIFTGPLAASVNAQNVSGTSGLQANALSFLRSGYSLTGGDLTLGGSNPSISVNYGESATIGTQLLGSDGLSVAGGGSVRLSDPTNGYTGTTAINEGALIISNAGALGVSTSQVLINGNGTRGLRSGGQLVLDGGYASGVNVARALQVQGTGPTGGGASLRSVRTNAVSGDISTTGTVPATITSLSGQLSMTGNVTTAGTSGTTFLTFGHGNGAGSGSYSLQGGVLSGAGSIQKQGGGTLLLNPSDGTNFLGTMRATAGSIRVGTANSLGSNTGTTTNAPLDLNGGAFEFRSDTPITSARNIYHRATSGSQFFHDHAVGGTAYNQTNTFGVLTFQPNLTTTISGRNGYNMSLTSNFNVNTGDNDSTITNSLNGGTLTVAGNMWANTNNAAARTLTVGGVGTTIVAGNLNGTSTAFNHNVIKTGTGTLRLQGTNGTLDGNYSINQGRLQVADFRSINLASSNATISLSIGSGTNTGVFEFFGGNPGAVNLTTGRTINLAGTTGGATIVANQGNVNPVLLNGTWTASGAGAKAVTLAGTNTANNAVNGVIIDSASPTSLAKTDTGTWVLGGNQSYTGGTTVSRGTLKLQSTAAPVGNIVNVVGGNINFAADATTQVAGGTLEQVGFIVTNSTFITNESVGSLVPTDGANIIRLTGAAGGNATSLIFSSLGTVGKGSGVNVITTAANGGNVTLTGVATSTATSLPGNGHIYIDGSNFARSNVGVLVAPVYGTDAGFVNAAAGAATLTAANNNNVTGAIGAQTAAQVTSLRLSGSSLTMVGGANLTVNTNGVANDGGILVAGNTSINFSGGGGLTTGGGGTLVFRANAAADNLTVNGPMLSTTTGGFTKNGAGFLTLTGANAQTGNIVINEGTVISAGTSIGGNQTNLVIRQGATLDIRHNTPAPNLLGAFNGAGTVTRGSAGTTVLSVGGAANGGTFSGIIQNGAGQLALTKISGTGTLSLTGAASSYTGPTSIIVPVGQSGNGVIAASTLANIGSNSSIGRGDSTSLATNQASLVIAGNNTAAASLAGLSYVGSAAVSTDRLFTFGGTGANTNEGAKIAANGVNNVPINFNNTGALAFGTPNTAQTLALGGTSTGDNFFAPQITDNGSARVTLQKVEAGLWHLTGTSNSYTGNTTVAAGILAAADGVGVSTNSPLVITGGGNFMTNGNFTRALEPTTTAVNQNSVNFGAGNAGLSAYNGKLVVSIGGLATPTNLTWASGGFVSGNLLLGSAFATDEVEVRNNIDLGAASRTIDVVDNGTTFTDFATITGRISGGTAATTLSKSNTGAVLQLFGDNSYVGNTTVLGGTLSVLSLGNSAVGGNSSVGAADVNSPTNAGAVNLGLTTTGANLQYLGAGETSDRKIRLNTTTATNAIHADGTGALILTNVANDMGVGSKTLALRGSNVDMNTITSPLNNDTAGTGLLSVNIDGGATWVLTGAGNFTGGLNVNSGALGIVSDSATLGSNPTNAFRVGNANIFAKGADLIIPATRNVGQSNNTATAFVGDYSIDFQGNYQLLAGANNVNTTTNGIVDGKTLTFASMTADAMTANRAWTFNGPGATFLGPVSTITAFNLSPTYAGTSNSTLTLTGAFSALNNGTFAMNGGRLILGASELIPDSTGGFTGSVTMAPAAGVTATFDLNGQTETINGFTASGAGANVIDNTSASAASLIFGGNNANVNVGGAGTYTITDSGAGPLSITKIGTGNATISAASTVTYQGTTNVQGGGILTIAAPVNGTTSLNTTGAGSLLALTGGVTGNSSVLSVSVDDGTTLGLNSGTGDKLTSLTSLTFGNATGTSSSLNFDVGDDSVAGDNLKTDTLGLTAGGSLNLFAGNQIRFNLSDAGLNGATTYVLLDSVSGGFLTGPLVLTDYILNSVPGGFTSMDLSASTDNQIILTTGNLITGASYFTGGNTTIWNDVAINWSSDKAGTTASASIPGAGTDVIFQADNGPSSPVNTFLEQNFKINSLTFEASNTTTPAIVGISAGASPANRLELASQLNTQGLRITAGGPTEVNISAPIRLSGNASQTWDITSNSTLNLSGAMQGGRDVFQTGGGTISMNGTADAAFNPGSTVDWLVNNGTLIFNNNTAVLGSTANSNLARLNIGPNGTFYNVAPAAQTVAHNITFDGGTLSVGGNNTTTHSGAINANATTKINLKVNNSAVITDLAINTTLSGNFSGSGGLIVSSNNTTSSGNQLTGSVTISGNNSAWSGDLGIERGSVTFSGTAATGNSSVGTSLDIDADHGRVIFALAGGTTADINSLTVDTPAGDGVFEFQANASGTPTSDMTINVNGPVTLGSATSGTTALRVVSDGDNRSVINFNGGIVMGNNTSISTSGSATRNVTIQNVGISESGGSFKLSINDDFGPAVGTWNQTNRALAINAAGNYTGGTDLFGGTLLLGHKDALGTGLLTIGAGSTLQSTVDLSAGGSGPVPNDLRLNAGLTVSGTGNLTINGIATGTGGDADRTLTSSIGGGNTLVLAGNVDIGASANTASRNLTLAGTGNTTISGNIVDGNAFTGNLTVTNTGTTILSGANTNSGTTTMNAGAGTLRLSGSNASAGATTLSAGTLQFNSLSNGGIASGLLTVGTATLQALNAPRSISNDASLTGNPTIVGSESLTIGGGNSTQTGSRTITNSLSAGAFRIENFSLSSDNATARTLTVGGTGATLIGNLTNNGNNNVLSSSVTGTGSLTVDSGVFLSESAVTGRTLTVNGAGNTTISGQIRDVLGGGGVNSNLTKSNAGVLTLSNSANDFTGTLTVAESTIQTAANDVLPDVASIVINANNNLAPVATLHLNGNNDTVGNVTFGGTGGSSAAVNSLLTGAGTVTFGGNVTTSATGTPTTSALISGNVALAAGTRTFNVEDSAPSPIDLLLDAPISGAGNLAKTGAGTLQLTGTTANTYSGQTTVSNGVLELNKTAGVDAIIGDGIAQKITPHVVVSGGTLLYLGNDQIADTGFIRVTSGTLDFNNRDETIFNLDQSGGTVNYGLGNITIEDPTWSGGLVNIGGSTTVGTQVQSANYAPGVNEYNVLAGGTLTVGTATTAGPFEFTGTNNNAQTNNEGTIRFRAGSPVELRFTGTGTSVGSMVGNGTFNLNGSQRIFNIGDAAGSATDMLIATSISNSSGTAGFDKTGAGTLLVSGTNTYNGPTDVQVGTLVVNGNSAGATGAVTVDSGATLAGTGTIGGATSVDGTHAPGTSVAAVGGVETFNSSLSYGTGSTFAWDLLDDTTGGRGTNYDGVDLNATALGVSAGVNSQLSFNSPGSTTNWTDLFWTTPESWLVFSGAGSLAGLFDNSLISISNDSLGGVFATSLPGASFSWRASGNDIYLDFVPLAVPEPASLGGAMILFGSWVVRRRMSRKKKAVA